MKTIAVINKSKKNEQIRYTAFASRVECEKAAWDDADLSAAKQPEGPTALIQSSIKLNLVM
jgi:hypothetical protein